MSRKQEKRKAEQLRRLSLFIQVTDHYEERQIEGNWWIKQWNGSTNCWQISIYSPESYQKYLEYKRK